MSLRELTDVLAALLFYDFLLSFMLTGCDGCIESDSKSLSRSVGKRSLQKDIRPSSKVRFGVIWPETLPPDENQWQSGELRHNSQLFLRDSFCLSAVSLSRQRHDIRDFSYCPLSRVFHVTLANWLRFGFEFHLRSSPTAYSGFVNISRPAEYFTACYTVLKRPNKVETAVHGCRCCRCPVKLSRSISLASLFPISTQQQLELELPFLLGSDGQKRGTR